MDNLHNLGKIFFNPFGQHQGLISYMSFHILLLFILVYSYCCYHWTALIFLSYRSWIAKRKLSSPLNCAQTPKFSSTTYHHLMKTSATIWVKGQGSSTKCFPHQGHYLLLVVPLYPIWYVLSIFSNHSSPQKSSLNTYYLLNHTFCILKILM